MAMDAFIFCDSSSVHQVYRGLWSRTEVSKVPPGLLCSKPDTWDYRTMAKGSMFQKPSVPGF